MTIRTYRKLGPALLGLLACSVASPLMAQASRLTPDAVGSIIDVVLRNVVPPGTLLSKVPVESRGLYLDVERTMAAFGLSEARATIAELGLKTRVMPGHQGLLSDCDYSARKPCRQLGWSAYVTITPIAVTDTHVVVRAGVVWPHREGVTFGHGTPPAGSAALLGFAADVRLARSSDGAWRLVRRERTVAY